MYALNPPALVIQIRKIYCAHAKSYFFVVRHNIIFCLLHGLILLGAAG